MLQRIVGRDVADNLHNFGAGLLPHREQSFNDLDGNNYPDLVISATKSDDVIVLFSKPVVTVSANMSTSSPVVDVIKCLRNANQSCVILNIEISARDNSISDTRRKEFGERFDCFLFKK